MNQASSVSPRLSARVWKAIAELNYSPNVQARALGSGKSKLLGVIVVSDEDAIVSFFIRHFEARATELGFDVLLSFTDMTTKNLVNCGRRMRERKVEGVLIATCGNGELIIDDFQLGKTPTFVVDMASGESCHGSLGVDYRSGLSQAIQHLAALGHRKIAFLSSSVPTTGSADRKSAFLECMRQIHLPINNEWIVETDYSIEGGVIATRKLLALGSSPTAIVCSYGTIALGAQRAVFGANLQVPKHISIIGFDIGGLAVYTTPPLTTIHLPLRALASATIRQMVMPVASQESISPASSENASTYLVVRCTTGKAYRQFKKRFT
jgi:LacI family transcriptional regulator